MFKSILRFIVQFFTADDKSIKEQFLEMLLIEENKKNRKKVNKHYR